MRALGVVACLLVPAAALATPNPWPLPRQVPAGPPGPALEISGNRARAAVPAVPSFAVPSWDGIHSPRELRLAGDRLRGRRVTVGGYITWIYDCAAALARRGTTPAETQRRIEADPSQCERPKFYLGDSPTTPLDASLWVVDVPRPPYKLERAQLTADELAHWPAVPRLAVGAYVEVTGTLALESAHHERSTDGLVIFAAIDTARIAPPRPTLTALPAVRWPALPELGAPEEPPVPPTAGDSVRHANAGARAFAGQQYDTAITEYDAAVRVWRGNHLAWYGLAGARSLRGDYRGAADAAAHAAALVPEQPMYWLLRGRMLYEATLADARTREAEIQGRRADDVAVDRAALDFTPALQALLLAVRGEHQLWRAHYYIGRILCDRGDARACAVELSEAIALHAWQPAPYLALAALYRRWGYRKEALGVAELATAALPGSADAWFELGMVRLERGEQTPAITAFSRALELKPDQPRARFQRGRAYLRSRDFSHARSDLQAFVAAGGAGYDVDQARRLLVHLVH
jgi:tetratricopeptide (TPR) repeat protein